MKKLLTQVRGNLFAWFIYAVFVWVHIALAFQVTMITLNAVNPQMATKIGNELTWKLDARFK